MRATTLLHASLLALLHLSGVDAISVNLNDKASIAAAAKTLANTVLTYYNDTIPGLLPKPYYWWESGSAANTLINHWAITGDTSYNSLINKALLYQRGSTDNYMNSKLAPAADAGNDDQAMWALAALTAAETKLPLPPTSPVTWLQLPINVFNTQVARWDTATCGGGLRWQIYAFNDGYDYKNSITQGTFFQLAARLALLTGNQTYAEWAETAWDWSEGIGLVDNITFAVYDGATPSANCSAIDHLQWSVDIGAFLYGSAVMSNLTNQNTTWTTRTTSLLTSATTTFFTQNTSILYEPACEPNNECDTDQQAYKSVLARWMGNTAAVAPFTADAILTAMLPTAKAAAAACSGGVNGTACGEKWYTGAYDGVTGVGEELSALEALLAVLAVMEEVGNGTAGASTASGTATATGTVSTALSSPATAVGAGSSSSTVAGYASVTATETATAVQASATATLASYTGAAAGTLGCAKEVLVAGAGLVLWGML